MQHMNQRLHKHSKWKLLQLAMLHKSYSCVSEVSNLSSDVMILDFDIR